MTDEEKAEQITRDYFDITSKCLDDQTYEHGVVSSFYTGCLAGLKAGREETKNNGTIAS